MAISDDGGRIIITTGWDGSFILFDRYSSTPLWTDTYVGNNWNTREVDISGNSNYIAGILEYVNDGNLVCYSDDSSTPLWTEDIISSVVDDVEISSNGNHIPVGIINPFYLDLYNRATSNLIWRDFHSAAIRTVSISGDCYYIVAGCEDDNVYLYSRLSSTPLWIYDAGIWDIKQVVMPENCQYFAAIDLNNCFHFLETDIPPENFHFTTDANEPDIDGSFNLNWNPSNNYTVYAYDSYITEINGSLTKLIDGTDLLTYPLTTLPNDDYFYVIGANNRYSTSMSICIKVSIQRLQDTFILSSDAGTDGNFN